MCDFNTVRNLFIAAMVTLGGAISSVILGSAIVWWWWGCIAAAAAWTIATLVLLGVALNALRAFCACAAGVSACADPCQKLTLNMYTLIATLTVGLGLCLAGLAEGPNWSLLALFMAAGGIAAAVSGLMAYYLVSLGNCQPAPTPAPPTTPSHGPGPVPM